jgi:hypothetical protein
LLRQALVLAILACTASQMAWGQATVSASLRVRPGTLRLQSVTATTLTFQDTNLFVDYVNAQTVTGATAPVVRVIDQRGRSSNGWRIQMRLNANFVGSAPARSFNRNRLTFRGGAGSIVKENGPPDTALPAEITTNQNMGAYRTVVRSNAQSGRGSYTWAPSPSNFSLSVPAGTLDDTYTSTLQITVVSGP